MIIALSNISIIIDVNNELPVKVTIAVSLVNEKKLDFILQKCTELGIYDFILVSSDRSKIKIDGKESKKIERWNTITKEAAEQSHRNIKPIIKGIMSIDEVSKMDYDLKLTCSTKENEKTIKNVLQNSTNCDRIIIVVGQPAPQFYLTPDSARVIVTKIKRRFYENNKKRLRHMFNSI